MDLNSAGLFVSVVDLGSFRKAALHLGVPVSTLSERITGLERALGVALLIRTTRRLTVTDAGRDLYDGCAAAVAALREAEERVSGLATIPAGTLRITAPAEFAEVQLADAIREYRRKHPHVRVETLLTNRYVDLIGEQFDIAVRGGHLTDSGLIARRLGVGSMILVASPAYLTSAPAPNHPRDLKHHPCVGFSGEGLTRGGIVWQLRGDAGARCAFKPQLDVTSSSLTVTIEHAQHDGGIALIPSYMVREALRAGRLVRVLPRWATAPIPVHIVVPQLRVPSTKTKDMVALLHARLQPLLAKEI